MRPSSKSAPRPTWLADILLFEFCQVKRASVFLTSPASFSKARAISSIPFAVPNDPTTNQSEIEPDRPDDLENILMFLFLYTRPISQPTVVLFA